MLGEPHALACQAVNIGCAADRERSQHVGLYCSMRERTLKAILLRVQWTVFPVDLKYMPLKRQSVDLFACLPDGPKEMESRL